jgi:hypothetical protein
LQKSLANTSPRLTIVHLAEASFLNFRERKKIAQLFFKPKNFTFFYSFLLITQKVGIEKKLGGFG